MELLNFTRFIGIDWSGANNPRRGLRLAQCLQGSGVPQIVLNKGCNSWRRLEVLDWLRSLNNSGERVLTGFDFAFAYPYCDEGEYFPGHELTPKDTKSLWESVNSICQDCDDFYAGPFYKNHDAPFADYLLYQNYRGQRFSNRMRITDKCCAKIAGVPSSVFKCVGPESVGVGSVAGMRMLHHVNCNFKGEFLIWPFQVLDNRRSVFVEIFPRLFYKLAGQDPQNWSDRDTVNNALEWFGSDALPSGAMIESEDQIDAIISAAAIRHLSINPKTWQSEKKNKCARHFEGWIFGTKLSY